MKQTNGVYGATYRWDLEGTDATLVDDQGEDATLPIKSGDVTRFQKWHFPARLECQNCHSPVSGYSLGFNTPQLNHDIMTTNGPSNQLLELSRAGYLSQPLRTVNNLIRYAAADDERWSRQYRARSFLAANCSQCHQPGGQTPVHWDARITTPLSQSGIVDAIPVNNFSNPAGRVVAPGSTDDSVLYIRLATLNGIHMPPLATTVLNQQALDLLTDWINGDLASWRSFSQWQAAYFPDQTGYDTTEGGDYDHDGLSNWAEYLLGTPPDDPSLDWQVKYEVDDGNLHISFPRRPNVRFDVQWNTDISDALDWQSLDVPENQPLITDSESIAEMTVPVDAKQKFFRVVISEP
jgi:hypothetical protein